MASRVPEFSACLVALGMLATTSAQADIIVQMGSVAGGPDPSTQDVLIAQFDSQGGARQLNFIRLDFLTSIIGGYQTDGSGVEVDIFAQLDAEWSLEGNLLSDTQALIQTTVPNTAPGSATVFNSDPHEVILDQPGQFAPWLGQGQLTLEVFTQFQVSEDPAGIIFFDAGGTVRYTVTYDYTVVPAPGAVSLWALAAFSHSRRRRFPFRNARSAWPQRP